MSPPAILSALQKIHTSEAAKANRARAEELYAKALAERPQAKSVVEDPKDVG